MSKASSQAARSGSSRCVRLEAQPQRDVEPGRQRDHREAGPDRQRKFEPVIDHQHRGGLADDGEPAQPHQRVEAHVAARVVQWSGRVVEHGVSLARRALRSMLRIAAAARDGACACAAAGRHICAAWIAPRTALRHRRRPPGQALQDRDARWTAFRLRSRPAPAPALLGGNGAGKTTTIAMIMGLVEPTAGTVTVLGAEMPRQRYRVLHRMNFESPYVDMPMRLTVRQNLRVFGMLYGVRGRRRPHRASWPTSSTSTNFSTGRPASCRPARRPASRWPSR